MGDRLWKNNNQGKDSEGVSEVCGARESNRKPSWFFRPIEIQVCQRCMRPRLAKLPVVDNQKELAADYQVLTVMAVTGGPHWPGQEKQIPLELVERIGQHLDGMSIIRLAATDSFMRKAAHHIAVLRLDSLAQEHPDLGASLARMGWTKTAAA